MKKLFILPVLLMPMAAFALDTSDCETIGYWQSTQTTCEMYDECVAHLAGLDDADIDPDKECSGNPRTQEECAQKIAQKNAADAEHALLIKCPVSDERLAHKNSKKNVNAGGKLVATDGATEINVDDLIADTEFVYYMRLSKTLGAIALMAAGGPDAWQAIGPRDSGNPTLFLSTAK